MSDYSLAHLKVLMAELQISAKKSLGQNFLVSRAAIEKIAAWSTKEPFKKTVEIGPGLGALTEVLPRPLLVIEMDKKLAAYWREKGGVEVIEGDALKEDWPGLHLPEPSLLVSNLPYQISSSTVIDRSIQPAGIARMILMFQKEVAQRILAPPDNKEYGLLSVIAQTFWRIEFVLEAGPKDFYPPPKIASRVLCFSSKECEITDKKSYLRMVKAAFLQRRKIVWKNLAAYCKHAQEIPRSLGFGESLRAENLSVDDYVRIFNWMRERGD